MAKASIHLDGRSSVGKAMSDYESRALWTEQDYERMNRDKANHYDITRRDLNFCVTLGPDGKPVVSKVDPSHNIAELLQKRIDELGYKEYKADASNRPNICVTGLIGGDHDRMCQLAYGDQEIAFDLSKDNSHVTRQADIEQWAIDTFEFACRHWGAENILGMQVHLDEYTPHAHLSFVPVAKRKQRGRVKPGQRKEFDTISYKGVFGETKPQKRKYMADVHTFYHDEVGYKYGLERGDHLEDLEPEERRHRVHKDKRVLEAERLSREAIQTNNAKVERLRQEAEAAEKKVDDLKAEEQNLGDKLAEARQELADTESKTAEHVAQAEEARNEVKDLMDDRRRLTGEIEVKSEELENLIEAVKGKSAAWEIIKDAMRFFTGKYQDRAEKAEEAQKVAENRADELQVRTIQAENKSALDALKTSQAIERADAAEKERDEAVAKMEKYKAQTKEAKKAAKDALANAQKEVEGRAKDLEKKEADLDKRAAALDKKAAELRKEDGQAAANARWRRDHEQDVKELPKLREEAEAGREAKATLDAYHELDDMGIPFREARERMSPQKGNLGRELLVRLVRYLHSHGLAPDVILKLVDTRNDRLDPNFAESKAWTQSIKDPKNGNVYAREDGKAIGIRLLKNDGGLGYQLMAIDLFGPFKGIGQWFRSAIHGDRYTTNGIPNDRKVKRGMKL